MMLATAAGAVILAALCFWVYHRAVDPAQARQTYDAALKLFHAGAYTEAILSLEHAISLQPKMAEAYLLRGRAHAAQGDFEAAIADYNQAIHLRPENAHAYI